VFAWNTVDTGSAGIEPMEIQCCSQVRYLERRRFDKYFITCGVAIDNPKITRTTKGSSKVKSAFFDSNDRDTR
jgi:hypothetical protein